MEGCCEGVEWIQVNERVILALFIIIIYSVLLIYVFYYPYSRTDHIFKNFHAINREVEM